MLSAIDRFGHQLVEAHVVGCFLGLLSPREIDEPGHERRQLLELADDVLQQPPPVVGRQGIGVASTSMFVLRLVSGRAELVRGVLDELPLRSLGVIEGLEHRVEARAEPAQLIDRRSSACAG